MNLNRSSHQFFRITKRLVLASIAVCLGSSPLLAAPSAPTAEQALALKPIQEGVQYETPTGAALAKCNVKLEKEGKSTSWVVRAEGGQILRRFADTNGDNSLDVWSYFDNGLEVYRDQDADFDSVADQYRWFHTGGSRWGIDENEDGKIDYWKQISPQEVAEEAVLAIQQKDAGRFSLLLVTKAELDRLGLGKTLKSQIAEQRASANSEFGKLAREQKKISSKSRFVDFGASRPGVIPAGSDGSTKDVTICENVSALVDNGGVPDQVLLGSLVQIGQAWRLVESPQMGDSGPKLANVFSVPSYSQNQSSSGPSQETQDLMAKLEKLDKQTGGDMGTEAQITARIGILEKIAGTTKNPQEQQQWYLQLSDLLSAAAQSRGYANGVAKLKQLESSPTVRANGKELVSQVRYRRIGAEYGYALQDPKADYAKLQAKWTTDLKEFVAQFPNTSSTPDALLQLGMADEFAGEIDKATVWYKRLAAEFAQSQAGKKATGAIRRLESVGKSLPLRGTTLAGKQIDLTRPPYRGKFVVVHYWATWCEPCKEDMQKLSEMKRRYGSKLEIVGVNLDNSAADAKTYLTAKRYAWENLYDEKGLEGGRASELGVMTLPLMIVVDNKGTVANRNLNGSEIETELQRLIR